MTNRSLVFTGGAGRLSVFRVGTDRVTAGRGRGAERTRPPGGCEWVLDRVLDTEQYPCCQGGSTGAAAPASTGCPSAPWDPGRPTRRRPAGIARRAQPPAGSLRRPGGARRALSTSLSLTLSVILIVGISCRGCARTSIGGSAAGPRWSGRRLAVSAGMLPRLLTGR